ncbi:MAG TPA: formylglycine-generating enzyme family protein [Candidatus Hydrogenedentes bacterium]|nr:formylglycine-generating enzyme family protein [Candidatus Hydrogenedentota bacterium]HQH69162.1 formylglycine-generating enzyme family protein [Candidatus Hydrogenedentota bacterium]HQM48582.1 formylglycine-generating enzyme family protein [Candidatus Hydrogenedentota bacterium]
MSIARNLATIILSVVALALVGCPPGNRPAVTSFAINDGAAAAPSAAVTLNNTCSEAPTEYMASESSIFAGAPWLPYSVAPSFTLSSGNGAKTVYFKVRNDAGESSVVSDSIMLDQSGGGNEETIILPGNVPLAMLWIEPDTFMMGRYPGELDSSPEEDPQHSVTLTHGFWMGKYELTKAQWTAVMGTEPWASEGSVLDEPDTPAVYVSWDNAQQFITQLNSLTGRTFRLPTEAEWECACRAGAATRFYWGDDPDYVEINDYAWWNDSAEQSGEYYANTVGQGLPNAFGLYDVSGNVWEWCKDWYDAGYYSASPATDPAGPASGSTRVLRGGSWYFSGSYCRSAYRYYAEPSATDADTGFRLAK